MVRWLVGLALIPSVSTAFPDMRPREVLHMDSAPQGITVVAYGETCQTPCDLHIPSGAKIALTVPKPPGRLKNPPTTRWTGTFSLTHPWKLSPDSLFLDFTP